jgi:hypothetical protein
MSEADDEIRDIVLQLRQLQVTQAGLVDRIEQLGGNTARPTRRAARPTARAHLPAPCPGNVRLFVIGDYVRVRNPGPFQLRVGNVTRITAKRIEVGDGEGRFVSRAPNNVVLVSE